MEALFLTDRGYVDERYYEIEGEKRPRNGCSVFPAARANESHEERHGNEIDRLTQEALTLDASWPKDDVEKRVVVMQELLYDLAEQNNAALLRIAGGLTESDEERDHPKVTANSSLTPLALGELPAVTQFGLKLFFRMCQSLRDRSRLQHNARLLVVVAGKLPSVLTALPPFPLSPGVVDLPKGASTDELSSSSVLSVCQELISIFASLLESTAPSPGESVESQVDPLSLSSSDKRTVLTALIALSVKWGRLRDLLHTINLLIQHQNLLLSENIELLHPALRELADAKTDLTPLPLPEEEAASGLLMTFGKGDHGKLGHGQCAHPSCSEGNCTENKSIPTAVASTHDVRFLKIDSLSTHSIAITAKGELMTWGNGDKYRLGHGTTAKEYSPRINDSLSLKGRVSDVACGLGHTIALMSTGDVYAWGNGSNGRLGVGDTNDHSCPTRVPLPGEKVTALQRDATSETLCIPQIWRVYCGASHSMAISRDGSAFAWGKNNQGQCGLGHTNDQLIVAEIKSFREEAEERVIQIAGGWEHTLYCCASGRVYSSGCGYKDSRRTGVPPVLGHGDYEKRVKPTLVQFFVDTREEIIKVSCGWDHSLAISSQGTLFTWGSGANGKLGHGDEESCDLPTQVRALSSKVIKDVKAGCEHTVVLTDDSEIWTFGQGDSGRLGHGDSQTRKVPTMIEVFAHSELKPVAIAVGDKYNLVLVEESSGRSRANTNSRQPTHLQSDVRRDLYSSRNRRLHSRQDVLQRELFAVTYEPSRIPVIVHHNKQGNEDGESDTELPKSDSECVLFMMEQICRLSDEFMTNMGNPAGSDSHRGSHIELVPYCVDTSKEMLHEVLNLLPKEQLDAWVSQNEKGIKPWNSKLHLEVVLYSLRILGCNFQYWLSGRNYALSTPKSHDFDTNGGTQDTDTTFHRVHEAISTLARSSDLSGKSIDDESSNLIKAIEVEAAQVIRTGFRYFYPSRADTLSLLWELSVLKHSSAYNDYAGILVEKMCADGAMVDVIQHFFARTPKHTCASSIDCQEIPSSLNSCKQHLQESPELLVMMLNALIGQCLSDARTYFQTSKPTKNFGCKLLTVIQVHLFGAVSSYTHDSKAEKGRSRLCSCIEDTVLFHLQAMVEEALLLLKELPSEVDDNMVSFLSETFLNVPLISAFEALYALVPDRKSDTLISYDNSYILRLTQKSLPSLQQVVSILDTLHWSRGRDDQAGKPSVGVEWIDNLTVMCGKLCTRLAWSLTRYSRRTPFPLIDDVLVQGFVCHDRIGIPIELAQGILSWPLAVGNDGNQDQCNIGRTIVSSTTSTSETEEDMQLLASCLEGVDKPSDTALSVFWRRYYPPVVEYPWRLVMIQCCSLLLAWNTSSVKEIRRLQDAQDIDPTLFFTESGRFQELCLRSWERIEMMESVRNDSRLGVIERAKLLLTMRPSIPEDQQSQERWLQELLHFLGTPCDVELVARSLVEWYVGDELWRVGLCVLDSLTRDCVSPCLKHGVYAEFVDAVRTEMQDSGAIPKRSIGFGVRHTQNTMKSLERLFHRLVGVFTQNPPAVVKKAALLAWLWLIQCNIASAPFVLMMAANSGIIPALVEELLSCQNSTAKSKTLRAIIVPWAPAPPSPRLASRFQPVEALLLGYSPEEYVQRIAFKVFSALVNFALDCSASTKTKSPYKSMLSAFETTLSPVFECLHGLLSRCTDELRTLTTVISPLTSHHVTGITQPIAPRVTYLVGSPLEVSHSRSQVLKPLELGGHQDHLQQTESAYWTISCWVRVGGAGGCPPAFPGSVTSIVRIGNEDTSTEDERPAASEGLDIFAVHEPHTQQVQLGLAVSRLSQDPDGSTTSNECLSSIIFGAIPVEEWAHIAISFTEGESFVACVNGIVSSKRKSFHSSLQSSLKLPFPFTVSCGGILSSQLLASLNLQNLPSQTVSKNQVTGPETIASAEVLIDDLWIFLPTPAPDTASRIYSQGLTLEQLKATRDVSTVCFESLLLLSRLTATIEPWNDKSTETNLSSWLNTLSDLLKIRSHDVKSSVCIIDTLVFFLSNSSPSPVSTTFATITELIGQFCEHTPSEARLPAMDLRIKYLRLHKTPFTGQQGASSPLHPHHQSLSFLLGSGLFADLLDSYPLLQLQKSRVDKDGGVDMAFAYRSVLMAATVKLLHSLAKSAHWEGTVVPWVNSALHDIRDVFARAGDTKPDHLFAIMRTISGYSERSVNSYRARTIRCIPVLRHHLTLQPDPTFASTLRLDPMIATSILDLLRISLSDSGLELRARQELVDEGLSSDQIQNLDFKVGVIVHLQVSFLRSVVGQVKNQHIQARQFRDQILQNVELMELLQQVGSSRVLDSARLRLGTDIKKAWKLRSIRAIINTLTCKTEPMRCGMTTIDDLEGLAEALWDVCEARRTLKARQHPWWQRPPSHCPSFLEVLGGDVEIQALTIRALQHFPSVRLGKVSITANSGLWYYEVTILSEGLMQIGYVDGDFVSDPLQGQGVGDHVNSWAFDGFRRKKWNVSSYDYGEAWRSGDIVGVLLDSDRMELSYFLNGKFLGVAFSGLPMTPTSLMYPAASLNAEQAIQFNFGARVGVTAREDMPEASVFVHLPQLDAVQDQDRLQSDMMAVDNSSVLEEADEEYNNESDSELSEYEFGIGKSDSEASGCYNEEVITGRVNQLPGSIGYVADEEVPTGDVDKYPVDETDDDGEESTRRLDLTTSLVVLGFPREWALRCAAETQFIAGDSAAVDWILEQMEQEGMSSVSMTLAGRTGVESSGQVEDITGPSVRSYPTPKALDDLSILSSNTSFGDQFSTLWGVHRVTRPRTEQYIRARGLEEVLTNVHSSDGHRHPEATDTDILCSGNDDNDIVSYLEELAVSSVSTQNAYTLPVTRDLNARLLGQLTGKEPAKDNVEPLGIDWAAEEEDLLPAWIVVGMSLSAAYARAILFETLFAVGDEENVKHTYRLVIGWINRDNRGFFDYLRRQMGLDLRDVRLSTATASAWDSCEPKLKIALCCFLKYERCQTEEPVSSLSRAMFNELHSHVKQALPVVTTTWPRLKASSFLVTQASNAHWSVWLSRVLADVPTERSGQHVLLSGVFLNNVLQVASRTAKCFVPWKVAAFSLLRDALRVSTYHDSDVSSEIQHFFHSDAVLKLFTARWKKEQTSRVAPSVLTSILWDILLCRQQLPQSAIFGNPEMSYPSLLQFHIENLSPTHLSVAWDQSKPTSDEYEADLDTSGTAESEASSSNVGADVLVLELLVREIEDADPQRFCTISSRVVPFSGSHAFRQLAPDTSYIIRLSTKTSSDEQVSTSPASSTRQLQFRTPPEPVFEIDASACGKNLLVLNQNLSVKNVINKKWHTVRGTVAFDEGIHQWHVRIDTCVSKNIFIGICTAQANLENYVGSDAFGYGFLANKAMWHNKTKLHSYGEIFKQGDLIQVTLDCNARTLAFSRNGESLGVAATNLHVSGGTDGEHNRFSPSRKCKWYPAFSLYNKDDQLTLIPPISSSASDGSLGGCSQHMSVLEMVHTAQWLLSTHIRRSRDDLDGLEPGIKRIYEDSFVRWKGWCRNTICWREVGRGDVLGLDCSALATEVFGMAAGDSVFTSKGQCVVVGVSNHELWYEVEDESSGFDGLRWKLDSWNQESCRVILESPDEYPIHRMQKQNAIELESTDDQDSSSTSSPIDLTLLDTNGFVQTQELWSRANGDVHLIAMLDALAATADHEDPHRLSQSELSTAFVMYDLPASVSNITLSHKMELAQHHDKNAVLARIFFLLDINQQLIRVIRFMLRNDATQVPWIDTSPPTGAESADDDNSVLTRMMELSTSLASCMSAGDKTLRLRGGKRVPLRAVLDFATRYLFAKQKEQIIREALEQSKTQTSSDATKRPSDSSAPSEIVEPPALPQLKIRWPSEQSVPFWRTESRPSATYALPDGKCRANTLFHQLSRQLCELNPSECRRGFTSPLDLIPIMRSFQLQVEGYPSSIAQAGELSDQNCGVDSDSTTTLELTEQYLKFWDSVMMEIQSPRFPLFIPVDSHSVATSDSKLSADEDDSRQVELDVNAGLLLPEVASMYLVREEQVLLWYFHVGQILGIAWRSQLILPLRYLSNTVWKDLISGHTESSAEATRMVLACTTAIGAIRDGICSIVPVECLHLSTPLSLRARLSDSDEMSVEVLKTQATYDPDLATHRMFWSIIESFSSLEMRMLLQFLTNSVRSVSAASITHGWSANQDLVEQWQRQAKECDQGISQRRSRVLSLELADALVDAHDHPDSCFPVVVVLEDRQSRLHLPQYSSIAVMRKKLLLSMTTPTSL